MRLNTLSKSVHTQSAPATAPFNSATPRPFRADQPNIIVLSDGRAGNDSQSLGVATALGVRAPEVITLGELPHSPRQWLPVPWLYGRATLETIPPADVLVATGRQMSRVSRWLRQARAGTARPVFTVQVQRPSGTPADYDVVALPWHDTYRASVRRWIGSAENVTTTIGALNPITSETLAEAAAHWDGSLRHLPAPRILVAIGGDCRHAPLRPADVGQLIDSLLVWGRRTRGSLLVTTSRRSGARLSDLVAARLRGQYLVSYQFWRPDDSACGPNPYLGYLALAHAMVATDDSVSMVSEGMTAGLPVYLWGDPARRPAKHQAFFDRMEGEGRLTAWDGALSLPQPLNPLADARALAAYVLLRLRASG